MTNADTARGVMREAIGELETYIRTAGSGHPPTFVAWLLSAPAREGAFVGLPADEARTRAIAELMADFALWVMSASPDHLEREGVTREWLIERALLDLDTRAAIRAAARLVDERIARRGRWQFDDEEARQRTAAEVAVRYVAKRQPSDFLKRVGYTREDLLELALVELDAIAN